MNSHSSNKALTLLELLIALILTAVIAVSIFSMDLFGRYHIINVDRRRRVQSQVSDVLEHMAKHVVNTIGNFVSNPDAVVNINASIATSAFYVDKDLDGNRDTGDGWIAYRHVNSTGTYQVQYCDDYNTGSSTCSSSWTTVGRNIWEFNAAMNYTDNFVTITITGCWNPSNPDPNQKCGSSDNPTAYMKTSFNLPSVSSH